MSLDVKQLCNMYQTLRTDRSHWEDLWEDVKNWIMPERRSVYNLSSERDQMGLEHLLDATAVDANQRLSSNMAALLSSPAIPWFKLDWEDPDIKKVKENREFLGRLQDFLYKQFSKSNFYAEVGTYWQDASSYNSCGMYFEDYNNNGDFRFETVPITNLYISEDHLGDPRFIFRVRYLTAWAIENQWEGSKDQSKALSKALDKNPFEKFCVIHAVGPAEEAENMVDSSNDWFSVFILENDKLLLNDSEDGWEGYVNCPYSVGKWNRVPEETYGTGPGIRTVADIKTLNRVIYYKDQAIPLAINPPILTTEDSLLSVGNRGEIEPGALIVKSREGDVQPWLHGSDFRVAELETVDLREKIKSQFYWNDLLLHPDRPEMTREEVIRRMEIAQRLFAPTVGLYQYYMLDKILRRAIYLVLHHHRDMLGPIPDVIHQMINQGLLDTVMKILYVGPLAQAQMLPEVLAEQQFAMQVISIAAQTQRMDLMFVVDWWEYFQDQTQKTGVRSKVLRSQSEFEEESKKYMEMIQRQAEMSTMREGAQAFQSAARGASSLGGGQ